jgi:hypothetical protein
MHTITVKDILQSQIATMRQQHRLVRKSRPRVVVVVVMVPILHSRAVLSHLLAKVLLVDE